MRSVFRILALTICIGVVIFPAKGQAAYFSISPTGSFNTQPAGATSITYDVFLNVEQGESFTFISWDFDMEYDGAELANWSASNVAAGNITEESPIPDGILNHLFLSVTSSTDVTFDTAGPHRLASITFDILDSAQPFDGMPDFSVVSQVGDLFFGFTTAGGTFYQFDGATGADVGAASGSNIGPTADAGGDRSAQEGSSVVLNGSGSSDPDDGIESYLWEQTAGPTVILTGATAAQASFTAPEVGLGGVALTFRLTVTDHESLSSTDSVVVTVTDLAQNAPPVADAGPDRTASEGTSVNLDGSGSSDPDDGIESYLWEQTDGPAVVLTGASTVQASFTAPEVGPAGDTLTFRLTVTDLEGLFASDSVTVTVADTGLNTPPVANAGPDQSVNEGSPVSLDASGSSDTDDGIESYLWEQTDGPQVTLSNADSAQASFIAPQNVSEAVTLTFLLTVTDRGGLWNTDPISVIVTPGGGPAASEMDGIYKDEKQTINAYVQTYTTGEILVILTPDLENWYVFLDPDWTDGITSVPDLTNQGHKLTMSFLNNGHVLTALVYGQGGSGSWVLERAFRSLQNSSLKDGIYKQGQDMNLYVQTYEEGSAIFIFTSNALEWNVFLDSDYSNGISVPNDLANAQHQLVMTSAGTSAYNAVVTPPSGPADAFLLNRMFAAPNVLSE
ncbi:MAG: hypothetical protein HY788_20295 [Deltaproteobacteria bacterium]|nr:hypothetical protein [Deltaproteobacteria bacterium]